MVFTGKVGSAMFRDAWASVLPVGGGGAGGRGERGEDDEKDDGWSLANLLKPELGPGVE
jgi:hypothetical protein